VYIKGAFVGVMNEFVGVMNEFVGVMNEFVGVINEFVGVINEFVGVMNEQFNSIQMHGINNVKLFFFFEMITPHTVHVLKEQWPYKLVAIFFNILNRSFLQVSSMYMHFDISSCCSSKTRRMNA
jgi:hypothetical protein